MILVSMDCPEGNASLLKGNGGLWPGTNGSDMQPPVINGSDMQPPVTNGSDVAYSAMQPPVTNPGRICWFDSDHRFQKITATETEHWIKGKKSMRRRKQKQPSGMARPGYNGKSNLIPTSYPRDVTSGCSDEKRARSRFFWTAFA